MQERGRVGLWLDNMSVCGWDGRTFVDNLPSTEKYSPARSDREGLVKIESSSLKEISLF